MSNQLVLFDYEGLDTETKIVVQQRTGEIKDLVRATAENIVRIGGKLAEVRNRLNNGGRFDAWLQSEFEWSRRTAYNFIAVHDQFGDRANFAQLDIATSALYLLAAPGTPPEARVEAIERAEAGERISHTEAKEIVAAHQPPRLPEPAPQVIILDNPPPAPWEVDSLPTPKTYAPQHSTAATFEQVTPPPPKFMADRLREDAAAAHEQASGLRAALAPATWEDMGIAGATDSDDPDENYQEDTDGHDAEADNWPPPKLPQPKLSPVPMVAPPPPPPPTVSGELLYISLTVRPSGALLSARRGDTPLAMENCPLASVGERVQALVAQVYGDDDTPEWLREE